MASTKKSSTFWIIASTGIPIAGGFGAAQLLTLARSEANGALGAFYFALAVIFFVAALVIAIVAKVLESRRGLTIAKAREKQLIQLACPRG